MNIPRDPDIPDDPHDAAAHWFTRERGGLMTPEERRAFEAWRAQPRHEQAYREMLRVWEVAEATPDAVFETILQKDSRPAGRILHGRRALMLGLGSASAAALAVAAVGPPLWLQQPAFQQRYASGRGERQSVELPDGSTLALNTDTVVQARFYDSERRVLLERGEAFFSVAADPIRPFLVDADLAIVKVTGTRFNVRRDADALAVAVESGSVEVAGGHWWKPDVRRLARGQGARIAQAGGAVNVSSIDVAAASAWRRGKAVFDAAPLEAIVAELNRYRARPIVLRGPALGQLRIAGVFSIDEPDAFLDALPSLAPVAVRRGADGGAEIIPR